MDDRTPMFDLSDHFDTDIQIGAQALPVHIKRYSRVEMEAFEKKWSRFMVQPRGGDVVVLMRSELAKADKSGYVGMSVGQLEALLGRVDVQADGAIAGDPESFKSEIVKFFEDTIREAVTIDEGLIRDKGAWVTDGAGFIGVFHARADVLGSAMNAVCGQNRLSGVIRKNLNSPRATDTGSGPSIQARGEDKSGSTVAPVVGSGSAKPSAATASGETDEGIPSSSGPALDVDKIH